MTQSWPSRGLLQTLVTAQGRHGLTSSGCRQEVLLARPLPSCWPLLGSYSSSVHHQSSRAHLSLVACRVSRAVLEGRQVAMLWGWA